jgi:hypothetical protein
MGQPEKAHPLDPRLEPISGLLRDAGRSRVSLREHVEGRTRLLEAVEQLHAPRRARWIAGGVSMAAAAAVVAFFVVAKIHGGGPLTFQVEGGAVAARGYFSAPVGSPSANVTFSDGSTVKLESGAQGRVAATTPDGAEVVLERGRANVHVIHREHTSWKLDAGPYAVQVTGTAFGLAWSPDKGALDVWMTEGRVIVRGPASPDGIALSAGQHLRAHDAVVEIDDARADALASVPTSAVPQTPTGASTGAPPSTTAPSIPADPVVIDAPSPTWTKLVSTGDYSRVLQEAHAQGESTALGTRPSADLRALADSARYAGDVGLARRAYAAIRSRFPSSNDARTAAFLLGRLTEEQEHAPARALVWYDTYLREAPGGAFAGDALGRKMTIVSRASGPDAARPLAIDYLRRFPTGTYASAAHNLAP